MDSPQLILVAGILLLALVNAASLIWALFLDRKLRQRPTPKNYEVHLEGAKVLSELDMTEVEQQAKAALQQAIEKSAVHVQAAIANSTNDISGSISSMVQTGFSQEFQKYQISLSELQSQTIEHIGKLQTEVDQRKQELLGQLEANIAQQRAQHMESFNQRINDVVAAYLAESLGNNVDLGAQGIYIMQMLEQHKEDIKRDVLA